jgi:hypothetical protein
MKKAITSLWSAVVFAFILSGLFYPWIFPTHASPKPNPPPGEKSLLVLYACGKENTPKVKGCVPTYLQRASEADCLKAASNFQKDQAECVDPQAK